MFFASAPAHVAKLVGVAVAAQESFQCLSWMYPRADSLPTPFVVAQKLDCIGVGEKSSKSVPPTAMLNGVEANPLTASPCVAVVAVLKLSQPAVPLSPEDTVTVIPWAAACSHNVLRSAFEA